MGGILEGFAIIGIVILVGYCVARLKILPKDAGFTLNRFAFFVAMPALMYTTLATADVSIVFSSRLPVAALSFTLVAGLYTLIFGVLLRRGVGRVTMGAVSSAMLNANNMGVPVAVYIFGDAAQIAPILLFQIIVVTPILLAIMDVIANGRLRLKDVLTQPVRNPLVIASMLGVTTNLVGFQTPSVVMEPMEILGGAGIPLVLVSFGMSLRGSTPLTVADQRLETITAALFKVVLMPLVAYLLGRFAFDLQPDDLIAAVMLAALPTAQNAYNYASRYQQSVILVRDIVLVSACISLPAMLVISWLLHSV
ncbi:MULTISPECIES: AEC family transporter [unclassified Rothia (in: high G+C Gram-positive bacteria)]|uniref:AEC family transporter n=1 Tax=unclassified Rothia (in: high G+C Gram-positive bacteria) TaxID=2689056 RepID=UPI00195A7743|nr:AEC family transporter [Rothia sp. ZJ932]MBM7051625.1 AEC family transporter [Rothia sp. ZJ1223]QRZ61742.1 AEC family transporter [Rothia sp. ZJ932]